MEYGLIIENYKFVVVVRNQMGFESASTRSLLILFAIIIGGAVVFIGVFVFPITNLVRGTITEDVIIIGTTGGNCGVQSTDLFEPKTILNCDLPSGTNVTISYQEGTATARIIGINNKVDEGKFVIIPDGAADPSLDPQIKDRPEEWYIPSRLDVNIGDTVTWINEDREKHTVTSGNSSGRFGFIQGKLGEPDGIFNSDLFAAGEEWSYTFEEIGVFTYFCNIHPWMSGMVVIGESDTVGILSSSREGSLLIQLATYLPVVVILGAIVALVFWFRKN